MIEKLLYRKYKDRAKANNIPFNIGMELFTYLIYQNCYYCNGEPSNIAKDRYKKNNKEYRDDNTFIFYNGIDRKENSVGYVKDNVVPCCKYCNSAKMDRPLADFISHIKQIYNNFAKDKPGE